jgi:hypothetical protein
MTLEDSEGTCSAPPPVKSIGTSESMCKIKGYSLSLKPEKSKYIPIINQTEINQTTTTELLQAAAWPDPLLSFHQICSFADFRDGSPY